MTGPTLTPLEPLTVVTLFGIRFWDAAHDRAVRDGLRVTARPAGAPGPVVTAFTTASGVYAFQDLPGLQALEYPRAGAPPVSAAPKRFVVEVIDRAARFVPIAFEVELPLTYKGVFVGPASDSPPAGERPGFYLFSAPTRSVSPGLAAVRAQLVDHDTEAPAAHAVLEVQVEGRETWYGLADERGAVAVLFPYPPITTTLGDSPPPAPQIPLQEQRWPLSVRVRYGPAVLRFHAGVDTPDLRSILRQPYGAIWPEGVGGPLHELSLDLTYGRELVMRTDPESALLISPGGSPL